MPVPDSFNLFKDFQYCEICEKDYTDDNFVAVVVDNDKSGAEKIRRVTMICKTCRERARIDPAFEKELTEKVMKLKLGRKLKNKTS